MALIKILISHTENSDWHGFIHPTIGLLYSETPIRYYSTSIIFIHIHRAVLNANLHTLTVFWYQNLKFPPTKIHPATARSLDLAAPTPHDYDPPQISHFIFGLLSLFPNRVLQIIWDSTRNREIRNNFEISKHREKFQTSLERQDRCLVILLSM